MSHTQDGWIDPAVLEGLPETAEGQLLRYAAGEGGGPEDERKIFVNRALRMDTIRTVGFDLDWTLADYHQERLSELAFGMALDRLVEGYDYPEGVRAAEFRPGFARRGVIIDLEAGVVLKMNRHRYVGRAYHGREFLGGAERARLYRRDPMNLSSKRYHFVDTLFELPEVNLYAELVELGKHRPEVLGGRSYEQLFREVRGSVDAIHADGTLKREIMADLPRYLPRDPRLPLALARLGLGGRRLVLITNSEHYYTEALCSYLFNDSLPGLTNWRDLFDLVVVEARKPAFFRKDNPFVCLGEGGVGGVEQPVPDWGGLYMGGCRRGLTELLDSPGERVLYVGDHIYGDVLSPKVSSTWRTALIIRELEDEIAVRRRFSSQLRHADVLRSELAETGQRTDDVQDILALYRQLTGDDGSGNGNGSGKVGEALHHRLAELKEELQVMRQHKNRIQAKISEAINPGWGSLFKQGSNKSLFGAQVDDFACIYTSRVSNFADYGSSHYFQVLRDPMMHDDDT